MAQDANAYGVFSGRPQHRLNLYVYTKQQVGNRTLIGWGLYAERYTGGWEGSYNNSAFGFSVNVGGQITNGSAPLPFSAGQASLLLATGEHWFDHDGSGYLTIGFSAVMPDAAQFGTAQTPGQSFSPERTIRPPSPPTKLRTVNITASNGGVTYDTPADLRGSTITGYVAEWYEINNTTNPLVWRDFNSTGYTSPQSGTVPGSFTPKPATQYHVYIYARSNAGDGERAGIALTTLPATAPKISVVPAISGRSARVTLSPPDGVTGVTRYEVQYRVAGSTQITDVQTTSLSLNIGGLTPGVRYEYRVRAVIGTYTSPRSGWVAATQPQPSTSPGDYFDGSSPAKQDTSYEWLGTPGKSRSREVGTSPLGWLSFAEGSAVSGGAGLVVRTAGGVQGANCTRVLFTQDTTEAGFVFGIGPSGAGAVEPFVPYWGSLFLQMFAEKRKLQPGVAWYNGSVYLSTSWGRAVDINRSQGTWSRLSVRAVSPEGATRGAAVVRDVDAGYGYGEGPYGEGEYGGSGTAPWSPFLGGDFVLLDCAMLTLSTLFPYFDGSTPDTVAYRYDWLGNPNASASSRTSLDPESIDPLADPDCPPPPAPPSVPTVPASCIVETGTWRRYWALVPESEIAEWKQAVPTISITTGPFAARQLRVRVYRNPNDLSPDGIDPDAWESEQILSYVPANTTMVLDGTDERAYAIVNGGAPRDAGHLLYGTGATPPTWPTLSCGDGYAFAFDVPLDAPSGNEAIEIQLTERH